MLLLSYTWHLGVSVKATHFMRLSLKCLTAINGEKNRVLIAIFAFLGISNHLYFISWFILYTYSCSVCKQSGVTCTARKDVYE